MLVGQIRLDGVLIASNGVGEILRPLVDFIPDVVKHHVELVFHLLHVRRGLYAVLRERRELLHGENNRNRAEHL